MSLGMTSEEAAALIISEGRTTDIGEAEAYANGQILDPDALQRAHLRRMMGFDFSVKIQPNKVFVQSEEGPKIRTHAKLKPEDLDERGNLTTQSAVDKLVDACYRLKVKWDAACEVR